MDNYAQWWILLIVVVFILLSWALWLVRDKQTVHIDADVYHLDPNYAKQTVCWGRTRGVRIGADTFPLQPPRSVWTRMSRSRLWLFMGEVMSNDMARIRITTAVSTPEGVKFTIYVNLQQRFFSESSVTRGHSDFVWLHDRLVRNSDYSELQVPAAPPCPDFRTTSLKLEYLETVMVQATFEHVKDRLRRQYEATFEKTVGAHQAYLETLASHAVIRDDINFQKFVNNSDL